MFTYFIIIFFSLNFFIISEIEVYAKVGKHQWSIKCESFLKSNSEEAFNDDSHKKSNTDEASNKSKKL
jgi:hypothetical protein